MSELDIYDTHQQLDKALAKLHKENIVQENKEIISALIARRESDGLSIQTLHNYCRGFIWLAKRISKPLDKLNEGDVREIVRMINSHCRSELTRVRKLVLLKKGIQVIKGYPKPDAPHIRYPPEVAWITTSPNRRKISQPNWDDLITEEEIYKHVIRHARYSRDRLLLVMLRESGARIGSIANTRIGDVVFKDPGFTLRARKDKTGPIDIPFYIATPYMHDWLDEHPHGNDPDAPLFVRLHNGDAQLKYMGIRAALRGIFERAESKKRSNPHHFRHSDASIMGLYLPTSLMEKKYNWRPGSSMPGYYQHVSGRQVDTAMRRLRGLEADELPKPMIAPFCKTCNVIAKIHTMRCPKCKKIVKMEKVSDREPEESAPENNLNSNATQELVTALSKALKKVLKSKPPGA